jgi:hypothetical protein
VKIKRLVFDAIVQLTSGAHNLRQDFEDLFDYKGTQFCNLDLKPGNVRMRLFNRVVKCIKKVWSHF